MWVELPLDRSTNKNTSSHDEVFLYDCFVKKSYVYHTHQRDQCIDGHNVKCSNYVRYFMGVKKIEAIGVYIEKLDQLINKLVIEECFVTTLHVNDFLRLCRVTACGVILFSREKLLVCMIG